MIPVTKTFLPNQDEYQSFLKSSWDKAWLTNRGNLVTSLESKLKTYLEVNSIIAMTNGTLPIQIAIKALELKGEIITTPFSYIATTSCIIWEGCKPVFVDIDPDYLTVDESKIESKITEQTSAILVTHVFGNPCNIEEIQRIAKEHNLKVIFDAAHCFGVKYNGESVFNFGDISTCSFHATKLFHTGEGGALFCNLPELYEKMFYHHNFGHNGPEAFQGEGTNAKMSELQGAMGHTILPYMDEIIDARKQMVEKYEEDLNFIGYRSMVLRKNTHWNYSYYPIIFDSDDKLSHVLEVLNKKEIYPRRYFSPSLNTIEHVKGEQMPISEAISSRVICLPLYFELKEKDIQLICETINSEV
ncbi:MAG: DegT/DnrJ/EryC1/StrS family aminotransferase [Flavobacteriales bacterium]|nr:DegT/DnrJ/EryC1/StrS family aminotransferase [Flavobacteriales bacterium]